MLATNIKVPAGGSIVVSFPFESVSVRRLLMNASATGLVLYYDTIPLINTSLYTALYELKFESYYGFPDASRFKLTNNTSNDTYVIVLIDTVPSTQINENYFTEVTI